MKRIILALFVQLLALPAFASATYTFTGPQFTTFTGIGYTPAMRVTGSFTTVVPLPPNMPNTNIAAQVTSYSFFDGVNTIASSDPNSVVLSFFATTDGAGQLTSAATLDVERWVTTPGVGNLFNFIFIDNGGGESGGVTNAQCASLSGSACTGYITLLGSGSTSLASPGVWTSAISSITVPTLQPWGIVILALLVMTLAVAFLRRRVR
jgi:hypothetical protein